jgi:hypothetical protein
MMILKLIKKVYFDKMKNIVPTPTRPPQGTKINGEDNGFYKAFLFLSLCFFLWFTVTSFNFAFKEQKFKYNEDVTVINGFFTGQKGKIITVNASLLKNEWKYLVNFGDQESWIQESDLK